MKRDIELRLTALEQKQERQKSRSDWVLADLSAEQVAAKLKFYKEIFQTHNDMKNAKVSR
jgi:predicted RNA-binding protein YlxR (DUF448 family)